MVYLKEANSQAGDTHNVKEDFLKKKKKREERKKKKRNHTVQTKLKKKKIISAVILPEGKSIYDSPEANTTSLL